MEFVRCLFVDMNSFFATAEQHLRPELRDRPIGVAPVSAETTSFIAASIEAKKYGVRTGTPVYKGRKLCPDIL
ncbi:MAG: DNA polymerase, partial [Planctomycetota bacterium]